MTDPASDDRRATAADRDATLAEILVVFGVTVGISVTSNALMSASERNAITFTDEHLLGLVFYQSLLAIVLVPWLARRGWSARDVAGTPGPKDVALGVALWALTLALNAAVWTTFGIVNPDAAKTLAAANPFAGGASAISAILVSIFNPIFEEFLWLGYAVPSLTPRLGIAGACAVSIALRVSVHAYQGTWALLGILPIGLALTWYYARTRRLWPAIVAHVIMDAVGLGQFLAAR